MCLFAKTQYQVIENVHAKHVDFVATLRVARLTLQNRTIWSVSRPTVTLVSLFAFLLLILFFLSKWLCVICRESFSWAVHAERAHQWMIRTETTLDQDWGTQSDCVRMYIVHCLSLSTTSVDFNTPPLTRIAPFNGLAKVEGSTKI